MKSFPAGVGFDCDGVLFPTPGLHAEAWLGACVDYVRALSVETAHAVTAGYPSPEGARRMLAALARLDPLRLADFKAARYRQHVANVVPYPGAAGALAALGAAGYGLALVTASRAGKALVTRTGLAPHFHHTLDTTDIPEEARASKLGLYVAGAERVGVAPGGFCVVEDSSAAIALAAAHGFRCVGVATIETPEELRKAGARRVVAAAAEVTPELIREVLAE